MQYGAWAVGGGGGGGEGGTGGATLMVASEVTSEAMG